MGVFFKAIDHLQNPKREKKKAKTQLVCIGINAGVFQGENRLDF
jgi:hypothetical protein